MKVALTAPAHDSAWRIALALAAIISSGCGSDAEPSEAVTSLTLVIHSAEWESERSIVVLGEQAGAEILTLTDQECPSEVLCPVPADVELRSSNPDVISPAQELVRAPDSVALIAHAPGTAIVTVTVDGLTQSRRVDVVTEPLPLDAIRLSLVTEWNDLPVQYDESQNLTAVQIPHGQYAALEAVALRNGSEVFGVPIHVTPYASYPPITEVTVGCRPTRVDILCEVFHDVWILGVSPGVDQITVWGRSNCGTADPEPCPYPSTTFTADVVEAPSAGLHPRTIHSSAVSSRAKAP